ncbi:maintenance of telomere capping protein 1 [Aspergillus pseudoustus]|uniref:Maintenance of telomere capping protein 1 n=1 Tax=Aspergillus pseudoustus TaxID=1810923 RepID=A0ABR4K8J7_9EURO
MPPKGSKPTSDELLAQFDNLGIESTTEPSTKPTAATTTAPKTATVDEDILAELDNLASQRPSSGAGTPRTSTTERPSTKSPKPGVAVIPASRSGEEKTTPRKSGDVPPTAREESVVEKTASSSDDGGAGGWWGGLFATASAAMKQAEAAVKEIQQNEEAQKWAQQVKGNVGALRDLGGELRSMAMPTFTSLIHTLAPPISSHERLQIHVTHDLSGYPSLDPLVYAVFSRVMAQVEGGDLLVIQRGQESAPKRGQDSSASTAGWHDGPWWRSVTPGSPRSISAVPGLVEATKLCRASAEGYATEYFAAKGGVEEAAKHATQVLSETNPVRSSDIFLAIQAVIQKSSTTAKLFQAGTSTEKASPPGVVDIPVAGDDEIAFALYLHDPIHGIAFHTVSQAIPQKWVEWLDAPSTPAHDPEPESSLNTHVPRAVIPEEIAEIVEGGGVDPREWAAEWIEEAISLATGVVAQRYVARRMGVGESGAAKGKMRAEQASVVESGAGEAARAL